MSPEQIVAGISLLINLILGIGALRNNKRSIDLESNKVTSDSLDGQFTRTMAALEKYNEVLQTENMTLRKRLRELE